MLDARVLVWSPPLGLSPLNHTALTLEALSTRRLTAAGDGQRPGRGQGPAPDGTFHRQTI